ncbi:hypothetical protein HNQ85_002741 [Anoxybacillus calidus]|jgi:hypothetical protein|uniref:Uncharacterized protein n=1 Tax=[Anoxybacillus] calidus TaxID=575178 RepID=A0A7V9Z1L3_9BACL|nr:hypothetical protein [Anoxybacillus calidus]MBA2872432.1 hypothetical protein [Anoxybacillus calidus]
MPLQFFDIKAQTVKFINEDKDPVKQLEQQNAELLLELAIKDMKIGELEQTQAELLLDLTMKGVI